MPTCVVRNFRPKQNLFERLFNNLRFFSMTFIFLSICLKKFKRTCFKFLLLYKIAPATLRFIKKHNCISALNQSFHWYGSNLQNGCIWSKFRILEYFKSQKRIIIYISWTLFLDPGARQIVTAVQNSLFWERTLRFEIFKNGPLVSLEKVFFFFEGKKLYVYSN